MRLLALALIPLALVAQDGRSDAEGCKDSTLVTRMHGCRISSCDLKDFDSVEVQVAAPDTNKGGMRELEGQKEILEYSCEGARLSPLQVIRNVEGALRRAGFQSVYSGKDSNGNPVTTMRKGPQWMSVAALFGNEATHYSQTAVKVEK